MTFQRLQNQKVASLLEEGKPLQISKLLSPIWHQELQWVTMEQSKLTWLLPRILLRQEENLFLASIVASIIKLSSQLLNRRVRLLNHKALPQDMQARVLLQKILEFRAVSRNYRSSSATWPRLSSRQSIRRLRTQKWLNPLNACLISSVTASSTALTSSTNSPQASWTLNPHQST